MSVYILRWAQQEGGGGGGGMLSFDCIDLLLSLFQRSVSIQYVEKKV